jgi:hypothetical protein
MIFTGSKKNFQRAWRTISSVAFLLVFLAACQPTKGTTPEKAFEGFTHAALRNRRKQLLQYATPQYIRELESVFDLMVISASWPANVKVERAAVRGEKAALVAQGLGRQNTSVYGLFLLTKNGEEWKVSGGDWYFPNEDGSVASPPADLDAFLKEEEAPAAVSYEDGSGFDGDSEEGDTGSQ